VDERSEGRGAIRWLAADEAATSAAKVPEKFSRDLSAYPAKLVDLARNRIQYLKEIDRQQPIAITRAKIEDLTLYPVGCRSDRRQ
jgi:hypothetical protein